MQVEDRVRQGLKIIQQAVGGKTAEIHGASEQDHGGIFGDSADGQHHAAQDAATGRRQQNPQDILQTSASVVPPGLQQVASSMLI